MIGEILKAVSDEAMAWMQANTQGGTVLIETDFLNNDSVGDIMPLVLLDMADGVDTSQWLGGATRTDWTFGMNSYAYMPNTYMSDATDYSSSLLNVIDGIRRHFSVRQWLTPGMTDIEDTYGFRFTLGGVNPAKALQKDGLKMGWNIMFESVAIDSLTDSVQPSASVLEYITQTGTISSNQQTATFSLTKNVLIMANTQLQIPANTFIPAIALQTVPGTGTPSVRIGITDGGSEICPDVQPGVFQLITSQYYCEAQTTLYFTYTGPGIINARVDQVRNYLPMSV